MGAGNSTEEHHTEYTKYPTQKRGTPSAVEVRTQLPLHRGRQPQIPQTPGRPRTGWTPGTKGEYIKEETHHEEKMSVMWTEGLEQLKIYVYDPEAQEVPVSPKGIKVPGGCLILSYTGAESQDSGLGHPELETKENPIEEPAALKGEPNKRVSSRDPRCRSVTLAPLSTLFGDYSVLGFGSANKTQPTPSTSWATDFLMEEAYGDLPLALI